MTNRFNELCEDIAELKEAHCMKSDTAPFPLIRSWHRSFWEPVFAGQAAVHVAVAVISGAA